VGFISNKIEYRVLLAGDDLSYLFDNNKAVNWHIDNVFIWDINGYFDIEMYNNNHITYLSNGNEIKGLWIEIGLSNEIFLTKYSWSSNRSGTGRIPVAWYIVGSNDKLLWEVIDELSNFTSFTRNSDINFSDFISGKSFKYYRFIITKLLYRGDLLISSFKLYGYGKYDKYIEDSDHFKLNKDIIKIGNPSGNIDNVNVLNNDIIKYDGTILKSNFNQGNLGGLSQYNSNLLSFGGSGANESGYPNILNSNISNGGNGINEINNIKFIDLFNNIGHIYNNEMYFGGGGGAGSNSIGGLGGGGSYNNINGLNSLGGGGYGGLISGNGGSGIIVIKYYEIENENVIPLTYNLLDISYYNINEHTINISNKIYIFKYNPFKTNELDQTEYILNLYDDAYIDILLIAGGGKGGSGHILNQSNIDEGISFINNTSNIPGGGGGGGGIIFLYNQYIEKNTYRIKVGNGGIINNGKNTSFSYLQTEAIGGSKGCSIMDENVYNGGSVGGSSILGYNSESNVISGNENIEDIVKYDGTILKTNYQQGYNSGIQLELNYPYGMGGGGANSNSSINVFDSNVRFDGGMGRYEEDGINYLSNFELFDKDIGHYINSNLYFGGGGAGGLNYNIDSVSYGGYGGGGNNFINLNGLPHTGGGGGGSMYKSKTGNGGSGIAIIKIKSVNTVDSKFAINYLDESDILNESSNFNEIFKINNHLDYISDNKIIVEHFEFGKIESSLNNNGKTTINDGIYNNYVKGLYTWNKPENVNYVTAYVWGAGGGGGRGQLASTNYNMNYYYPEDIIYDVRGGNGGFVKARIDVSNIDKLKIVVGEAGGHGVSKGWGGGGDTYVYYNVNKITSFGKGGGLSGIFLDNDFMMDTTNNSINGSVSDSSIVVIAGGGGGASGFGPKEYNEQNENYLTDDYFDKIGSHGGHGGIIEELKISKNGNDNTSLNNVNGSGGSFIGGIAGISGGGTHSVSGANGIRFKGGRGGNGIDSNPTTAYGNNGAGSGGGGWYGGGGGSRTSLDNNMITGSGGGGSSYWGNTITDHIVSYGNTTKLINTNLDVKYDIPGTISLGGSFLESSIDGGNGYIILEYEIDINKVNYKNLYVKYEREEYKLYKPINQEITYVNIIGNNFKVIDTYYDDIIDNNNYLIYNKNYNIIEKNDNILIITNDTIIKSEELFNCLILYINGNNYYYDPNIKLDNNIYNITLNNIKSIYNEVVFDINDVELVVKDDNFNELLNLFNMTILDLTQSELLIIKYYKNKNNLNKNKNKSETLYFGGEYKNSEILIIDNFKYYYNIVDLLGWYNFDLNHNKTQITSINTSIITSMIPSLTNGNEVLKNGKENTKIINSVLYRSDTVEISNDNMLIFKYDINNDNGNNQTEYEIDVILDGVYDILIVAGGGSGGYFGGGGGAGGLIYKQYYSIKKDKYIVKVGNGARGTEYSGNNGFNSSLDELEAIGGGGGAYYTDEKGKDGGSGGGGIASVSQDNQMGGNSINGQGFNGGMGNGISSGTGVVRLSTDISILYAAGGGGGAGQSGEDSINHMSSSLGSDKIAYLPSGTRISGGGGNGLYFEDFKDYGDNGWFAGGGSGTGTYSGSWGHTVRSLGGGGRGTHVIIQNNINYPDGYNYTGSGGAAVGYGTSTNDRYTDRTGHGGSGIVIIKKSITPQVLIPNKYINHSLINNILEERFDISNEYALPYDSDKIININYNTSVYSSNVRMNVREEINNENKTLIFGYDYTRSLNDEIIYILDTSDIYIADIEIGNDIKLNEVLMEKITIIKMYENNMNTKMYGINSIEGNGVFKITYNYKYPQYNKYNPRIIIKYKEIENKIYNPIITNIEYKYEDIFDNIISTNLVFNINNNLLSGIDPITLIKYDNEPINNVNISCYKDTMIEFNIKSTINNPFIIINIDKTLDGTDTNKELSVSEGIYIESKGLIDGKIVWNANTIGTYYCISVNNTNINCTINIIETNIEYLPISTLSLDYPNKPEYHYVCKFLYDPTNDNGNGETEYTLIVEEDLLCDILIVAGGGGGGSTWSRNSTTPGAGGGAGGLIFLENQIVDGITYTVKVGKGGDKARDETERGQNGFNSSFSYLQTEAIGGGGGASGVFNSVINGVNGGSGGGGSAAGNSIGNPGQGYVSHIIKSDGTIIIQNYRQGFEGGYYSRPNTSMGAGGGAGGAATIYGTAGIGKSGNGSIDFKTLFGISDTDIGEHHTDHKVYFAGGGAWKSTGGLGGGGDGNSDQLEKNGKPNTGGGGAGGLTNAGGNGGSGIVILKFYKYFENIPEHNIVKYIDDKIITEDISLNITYNIDNENPNNYYEKRNVIVSNYYESSMNDIHFVKLGYTSGIIPDINENDITESFILNGTNKVIKLIDYKIGKEYKILYSKYETYNYVYFNELNIISNQLGIYDIIIKIDNNTYIFRINDN
tara:strand:- start:2603 stop:9859 length:7257 start_codon:yes stop_codon:yes gene_type:complete